ncbi:MAG TPA: benzoate-CoA ligase family protein [Mycobacterium sp.]|nr:benzoate-CoA ligase family protein [Mycobacterium sp.]
MDVFNAADFLVHRHLKSETADKTALIGSRELTYRQLSDDVAKFAGGLRGLGLRRDDRIVMVMADDVELATSILAAFHAGFVAVPVSTMLNGKELSKIVQDAGARAVIATPPFVGTVLAAVEVSADVTHLVLTGDDDASPGTSRNDLTVVRWTDLLGPADEITATEPDAWALWLYTSGTTGTPKAAMHRHANIRAVYETYGQQTLGIRESDRCLSVPKMFFAYGIGNSLFFPLAAGATTILQPQRPTPECMSERLIAASPTLFFAVPTFYSSLLASDVPADAFAGVRMCVSAGEVLPEIVQTKFKERFGVDILDGIGSTEALHIFLSNRPDDIRPGTTGKPVPGYKVEVRDADGGIAAPGVPGDLYVSGESIALGYWRRADANRAVFQGEWLCTGDTYVVDEAGYYHCLGRSNDLLKAGGIWVSPAEVEERLLEHDAVAEAAVVGLPDAEGIDKPAALVVRAPGHDGVTADDLIAWCREGLAAFKRPRSIEFCTELPKTATGKMQRFRVRELLHDLRMKVSG